MERKIVWNKIPQNKLLKIYSYILEESSSHEIAIKYIRKIRNKTQILKKYAKIGRVSKANNSIRFYNIDKYKTVYYRVEKHRIVIVNLFDMRQNPKNNPYL